MFNDVKGWDHCVAGQVEEHFPAKSLRPQVKKVSNDPNDAMSYKVIKAIEKEMNKGSFKRKIGGIPGPSDYFQEEEAEKGRMKVFRRSPCVPMMTEIRGCLKEVDQKTPGPGAYLAENASEWIKNSSKENPKQRKVIQIRVVGGKEKALGPGSYDPKESCFSTKTESHYYPGGFGSGSKRF